MSSACLSPGKESVLVMFMLPTFPSVGYAVVFSVSFWSWIALECWVFARDRGKAERGSRSSALWFILTLGVGIALGLNMAVIAPGFNIQGPIAAWFGIGILLIWAGILFRFWSIQTLGRFFSTRLMIQERHELIMTGPYKCLRNPSYTGALVMFFGFGLGAGNWLSTFVQLCTGLVTYIWRIRVEERMLIEQFGQAYVDYKKRSWALIPLVW